MRTTSALNFSPISFRNFGSGVIRYRLKGVGENWTEVPITEPTIRFFGIAPGYYDFEAVAVNEDGVLSETVSAQFSIAPPFWKSWWFYGLIALTLIVVVSGVFLFRIREIKKRDKVQHDLRVSELTALKAQMNPHFVFNALNSIQEYALTEQPEKVNEHLGKFARLMRKTLDRSQQATVTLQEEIELLELYLGLEAIRFEDGFVYKIEVEGDLHDLNIPSMIVQPFVENAIKHGLMHKKDDRELCIRFKRENNTLICEIMDNGIGLIASEKLNTERNRTHRSFSTGAIQKRLDLLNRGETEQLTLKMTDLSVSDSTVSGTLVVLRIPIKNYDHA